MTPTSPRPSSFTKDRAVLDHRLAPGTVRRILGFARPYRTQLVLVLGLVVLDAVVGAATPLIYRAIIDQGIQQGRTGLVVALAGLVAGLAVVSAAMGLAQRWYSAKAQILGLDCWARAQELRHRVGYMPERPRFYDWMTVGATAWLPSV